MSIENCVQALSKLGFSTLESEVYALLVQESPCTGYRVAQALGKPVANVYKAIESLESKGAVLVNNGSNRLCRAVPPEDLLSQLDHSFQHRRSQAADALSELRTAQKDEQIYQLKSREQVIEKCRSMLSHCKRLALMDVFPELLDDLKQDIEAAADRGVQITLKSYQSTEIRGVEVVVNPQGAEVVSQYPGQWLVLIIDGAELLVASVDCKNDIVHQAICSNSLTLSWIFHCSFAAEMIAAILIQAIEKGATIDHLRAAIKPLTGPDVVNDTSPSEVEISLARCRRFYGIGVPGYDELLTRYGHSQ